MRSAEHFQRILFSDLIEQVAVQLRASLKKTIEEPFQGRENEDFYLVYQVLNAAAAHPDWVQEWIAAMGGLSEQLAKATLHVVGYPPEIVADSDEEPVQSEMPLETAAEAAR